MNDVLEIVKEYKRNAPVSVPGLVRALGLDVDETVFLFPELAGLIERRPNGAYRIVVNARDSEPRKRFTIAHELGHYLLHRDLIGNGTDDNRAYRSVAGSQFYNSKLTQAHETEANRFAAGLLMPADLVRSTFAKHGGKIDAIASDFGVSRSAMVYRLKNLGLIDEVDRYLVTR